MENPEQVPELKVESGIFKDFTSSDDFLMAFAVVNNKDLTKENCCDILSKNCVEALKFVNIYASKINTSKEDVLLLLEEYGLPFEIASKVVTQVIRMSYEYQQRVNDLFQSLVSFRLVDFDWSLKLVMCDSNAIKQEVYVIRLSLVIEDASNERTTYVLELDHSQLYSLINELDSVDRSLGRININL